MRNILLILSIPLFIFGAMYAQLQETNKGINIIDEIDTVYVEPGKNIYHLEGCEKLGKARTGMPLSRALEKGYIPCSLCLPEEKQSVESIDSTELKSIQNPGFRGASWGISQDEVKKLENSEFINKEYSETLGLEFLGFKGQAGGLDCLIAYYFAENKLVEGRYIFVKEHTNRNLYIDDFNSVKKNLLGKYGQPDVDNTIWLDDLYKNDTSEWGMAISVGHLAYETIWKFKEMKIMIQLKGDNYKITHIVDYVSELKEHKELIEKAKKRAKKDIW